MSFAQSPSERLRQLARAGVVIPWEAAGLEGSDLQAAMPAGSTFVPPAAIPPAPLPVQPPPQIELDLLRLEQMGYLVPEQATSIHADEFRQVKRAVLGNVVRDSADDRSALIMVTSALPGEGKTFCAINLAMSIAMEVDTSVLLVDADVLRPSVFERLGLPEPRRGLLDILGNERLSPADVMLRTNVPKLSLLPTGTLNSHASELLASGAMQQLLHDLVARYPDRVVVFDTPPLLVASGAATLAASMGQVVMVVQSGTTSRRQSAQAFAALEQCPIVMSLLNRCRGAQERHAYGSYYGYGAPRKRRSWFGG